MNESTFLNKLAAVCGGSPPELWRYPDLEHCKTAAWGYPGGALEYFQSYGGNDYEIVIFIEHPNCSVNPPVDLLCVDFHCNGYSLDDIPDAMGNLAVQRYMEPEYGYIDNDDDNNIRDVLIAAASIGTNFVGVDKFGKRDWAIGTGVLGGVWFTYDMATGDFIKFDSIENMLMIFAISTPTIMAAQYVIGCGVEIINSEIKKLV